MLMRDLLKKIVKHEVSHEDILPVIEQIELAFRRIFPEEQITGENIGEIWWKILDDKYLSRLFDDNDLKELKVDKVKLIKSLERLIENASQGTPEMEIRIYPKGYVPKEISSQVKDGEATEIDESKNEKLHTMYSLAKQYSLQILTTMLGVLSSKSNLTESKVEALTQFDLIAAEFYKENGVEAHAPVFSASSVNSTPATIPSEGPVSSMARLGLTDLPKALEMKINKYYADPIFGTLGELEIKNTGTKSPTEVAIPHTSRFCFFGTKKGIINNNGITAEDSFKEISKIIKKDAIGEQDQLRLKEEIYRLRSAIDNMTPSLSFQDFSATIQLREKTSQMIEDLKQHPSSEKLKKVSDELDEIREDLNLKLSVQFKAH